jgi:hypothetical protein
MALLQLVLGAARAEEQQPAQQRQQRQQQQATPSGQGRSGGSTWGPSRLLPSISQAVLRSGCGVHAYRT